MTNRLVITDNASKEIVIRCDDERFSLYQDNKGFEEKVIILNPVEAKKVAKFIKENLDVVPTPVSI